MRTQRLRYLIALALILWCGGAGCMLVSYAHGAMGADESPRMAERVIGSTSGSMTAHHCCKSRHKAAAAKDNSASAELDQVALPSTPAPSETMSCCPLTSGSIVVTSRSQSSDVDFIATQTDSSFLKITNSTPAPLAVPLRLPNRAQSYLLDCVFLM